MNNNPQQFSDILIAGKDVEYIKKIKKPLEKNKVRIVTVYSVKRLFLELSKKPYVIILFDHHSFSNGSASLIQEINKIRFQGQYNNIMQNLILILDFEDKWILQQAMKLHLDGVVLKNQNLTFLQIQVHALLKFSERSMQTDIDSASESVKNSNIPSEKYMKPVADLTKVKRKNILIPATSSVRSDHIKLIETNLKMINNLLPSKILDSDPFEEIARINHDTSKIIDELLSDFNKSKNNSKNDKNSSQVLK